MLVDQGPQCERTRADRGSSTGVSAGSQAHLCTLLGPEEARILVPGPQGKVRPRQSREIVGKVIAARSASLVSLAVPDGKRGSSHVHASSLLLAPGVRAARSVQLSAGGQGREAAAREGDGCRVGSVQEW